MRHPYRYLLSLRRYEDLVSEISLYKEVNVDTSTIAPFAAFDLFPENPEDVPWIQTSPPALCPEKMEAVGQTVCPECGARRYTVPQGTPLALRRDVIEAVDVDIWKSSESFGQGGVWARTILISGRFYAFLAANRLDRQFRFEIPVLESPGPA